MTTALENYRWAGSIVQDLIAIGVEHFFIAPGSRSAPLSMVILRAADAHDNLHCYHHFDERSLAFAALGAVKGLEKPAVVVTSSGSAVGNLLPAMIEASQTNLPLIALTADRPAELIGVGANQAIPQPGIFSHFVRAHWHLPLNSELNLSRDIRNLLRSDPGPIHINVPFAEPLYPPTHEIGAAAPLPEVQHSVSAEHPKPSPHVVRGNQAMILAGALTEQQALQVLALAEANNLPILADAGSQLRQYDHPLVMTANDYLLHSPAELFHGVTHLFQFGGRVVSKAANRFLSDFKGQYSLISDHHQCLDPTGQAQQRQIPTSVWAEALDIHMTEQTSFVEQLWLHSNQIRSRLQPLVTASFSEYSVMHTVSQTIPEEHRLFLGNSLSIRLYDQVAAMRAHRVNVVTNRGASGIDGLIATAAGLSLASDQAVTAVIGDLSALYDLNSLYWLAQPGPSRVLVILNNDGGQIFSMLPAAQQRDVFDPGFLQPHGLEFGAFAQGFNVNHRRVTSYDEFSAAYQQACTENRSSIIEVILPSESFMTHRQLIQQGLYD